MQTPWKAILRFSSLEEHHGCCMLNRERVHLTQKAFWEIPVAVNCCLYLLSMMVDIFTMEVRFQILMPWNVIAHARWSHDDKSWRTRTCGFKCQPYCLQIELTDSLETKDLTLLLRNFIRITCIVIMKQTTEVRKMNCASVLRILDKSQASWLLRTLSGISLLLCADTVEELVKDFLDPSNCSSSFPRG